MSAIRPGSYAGRVERREGLRAGDEPRERGGDGRRASQESRLAKEAPAINWCCHDDSLPLVRRVGPTVRPEQRLTELSARRALSGAGRIGMTAYGRHALERV